MRALCLSCFHGLTLPQAAEAASARKNLSYRRKRKSRLAEIGGITNYRSTAVAPALSSNLAHSTDLCAGAAMEVFSNATKPNRPNNRVHEHNHKNEQIELKATTRP